MTVLFIGIGAAIGAPLRYFVDVAIGRRRNSVFPWGTLVVNVAGSFFVGVVLALAAGGHVSEHVAEGLAVGLCGALTTYSTFSYETLRLAEGGALRLALANVVISVAAGLGAVMLGWTLGTALG
jgi:CrcB protein